MFGTLIFAPLGGMRPKAPTAYIVVDDADEEVDKL